CWPLPREFAAALWQAARVNIRSIRRRFDFKRVFEASRAGVRQIPAAFALTGIATMLIRTHQAARARQENCSSQGASRVAYCGCYSRRKAHRRGWMIHPRDVAVRETGALEPLFYFLRSQHAMTATESGSKS